VKREDVISLTIKIQHRNAWVNRRWMKELAGINSGKRIVYRSESKFSE